MLGSQILLLHILCLGISLRNFLTPLQTCFYKAIAGCFTVSMRVTATRFFELVQSTAYLAIIFIHQVLVCALLNDATITKGDDHITMFEALELVGHNNTRLALHDAQDEVLKEILADFRV